MQLLLDFYQKTQYSYSFIPLALPQLHPEVGKADLPTLTSGEVTRKTFRIFPVLPRHHSGVIELLLRLSALISFALSLSMSLSRSLTTGAGGPSPPLHPPHSHADPGMASRVQ